MKEDIAKLKEKFDRAYTLYLKGAISWSEFEPVKKEWAEAAKKIGEVSRKSYRDIEKDLKVKYGKDYNNGGKSI
jgi:hypothetical protein